MTELVGWCSNSRRWLLFMDAHDEYPKTCPHEGDCDECGYFKERKPTAYFRRREKMLKEVAEAWKETEKSE